MIRGVRGATTVQVDTDIEILTAVERLLREMIELNSIEAEKVASIFISMTEDLRAAFPAKALRKIDGWTYVPVVCMQEIPIVNSLPFCIRIMLHLNTDKDQTQIQHVYQEGATVLRPDLFIESQ
ncbi:chorismate mutase [Peribacillus psychrosaccharolyticus]|uniref:chorismate mutase n=1 Tax=Peribacillus psychrosaccharolyticus TaxID=1407 RepID=A0A974NLR5_PERPY|nr:chorismate mutase [Peribacillus psychrosaccharolyticus]MEC2056718.1 chorismate mutase [Peribacillus psychrosaccharolyticus]MED3746172.1 chorismate mutase [Peribacillus psychrosaccharolyticus]QQT00155.1 chorismate mutase [Peribacillus psychrosaccharolyticus]